MSLYLGQSRRAAEVERGGAPDLDDAGHHRRIAGGDDGRRPRAVRSAAGRPSSTPYRRAVSGFMLAVPGAARRSLSTHSFETSGETGPWRQAEGTAMSG